MASDSAGTPSRALAWCVFWSGGSPSYWSPRRIIVSKHEYRKLLGWSSPSVPFTLLSRRSQIPQFFNMSPLPASNPAGLCSIHLRTFGFVMGLLPRILR
jgi:hypothetical protein